MKKAHNTIARVLVVDPPSGWRFGFPAILQKDYRQQLIDANYPSDQIELAIRYSRYWESEVIGE